MKNCKLCATENDDVQRKCSDCGTEQAVLQQNDEISVKKSKTDVISIIGFALSILTLIIMLFFVISMTTTNGLGMAIMVILAIFIYGIPAVLSIILNIVGITTSLKLKRRGKWFAITGLIIAAASTLILIVFITVYQPSEVQAWI